MNIVRTIAIDEETARAIEKLQIQNLSEWVRIKIAQETAEKGVEEKRRRKDVWITCKKCGKQELVLEDSFWDEMKRCKTCEPVGSAWFREWQMKQKEKKEAEAKIEKNMGVVRSEKEL